LTDANSSLKAELLATIPSLRAFAMSLAGQPDRADDLVQETLMKAWANLSRYEAGTNLRAWLFTILRNTFYSEHRKHRLEIEDADGHLAAGLSTPARQNDHMDFEDFRVALLQLAPDQREALILVGASGLSYEEAAEICGCAVGTIKSRVNRARGRLGELLGLESANEAPASTMGAIASLRTSKTVRPPGQSTRRNAIGAPMLPSPINPSRTVVVGSSRRRLSPAIATPRAKGRIRHQP